MLISIDISATQRTDIFDIISSQQVDHFGSFLNENLVCASFKRHWLH